MNPVLLTDFIDRLDPTQGLQAVGALGDQFRLTTEQVKANEDAMDRLAMKYKLTADYTERQIALLEREAAAHQKVIDTENKRRGVDSQGFSTGKDGQRLVAGTEIGTLTGIAAFLKNAGVSDDAAAKKLALEFSDGKGALGRLGWSQIDFAERAGLTPTTVSRWATGNVPPPPWAAAWLESLLDLAALHNKYLAPPREKE